MQAPQAASKECWAGSCTPLLARVTPQGQHGVCRGGSALCCIMGCRSQLDLAGVQDSVRSPAEIVQSWQWQWQGTAGVQRAPRTSFWFCIYSGKNKPLRCYNGIQLTNWKTSSILQGNRRLSVLDVCSKMIFSLNILYIYPHAHIKF